MLNYILLTSFKYPVRKVSTAFFSLQKRPKIFLIYAKASMNIKSVKLLQGVDKPNLQF